MNLLAQQMPRIGSPILGYVIPAVIFVISFLVAFLLYRKFTREMEDSSKGPPR